MTHEDELEMPERPLLTGDRVILRAPRPSDRDDRLAVGIHPEFVRMLGGDETAISPWTVEDVEHWYARVSTDPWLWMIEVTGRAVGTVRLRIGDEVNRSAWYSIGIFDPTWWDRGIGTETTRLVLRHAFVDRHLHRVALRVLTDNHRAIAAYEKCGFVREGIERETLLARGEWRSDLMMSMLEDEFRHQAGR
jgi:ribosomal-protein-alanine N-acetyltransferase